MGESVPEEHEGISVMWILDLALRPDAACLFRKNGAAPPTLSPASAMEFVIPSAMLRRELSVLG